LSLTDFFINNREKTSLLENEIENFQTKIKKVDEFRLFEKINYLNNHFNSFFYFGKPSLNYSLLAIDKLLTLPVNGKDYLEKSGNIFSSFKTQLMSVIKENEIDVPLFIGSAKFCDCDADNLWGDFNNADWFIPKYLLLEESNNYYEIRNFIDETERDFKNTDLIYSEALKELYYHTESDQNEIKSKIVSVITQPESVWKEQVNSALEKINQNLVKKIVLSRKTEFKLDSNPDLIFIVKILSEKYPDCYIYLYKSGESIFFGASPEKLFKVSKGVLETDALAGSIQRVENPEEYKMYERELLSSKKNIAEQQTVVDFIIYAIRKYSENIHYNIKPIIKKLPNIQHLWTKIIAELNDSENIFDILNNIHPTPAIGGFPKKESIDFIKQIETHSRGLFTGIIGWFNFNGSAEFAVGIRSALLKDKTVYAFAGCGIVEGSDPQLELEETNLKLKPILSLFEYENKS